MLEAAVLNVEDHAEQIALAEAFVRRRHDDARLRVPLTKHDRETLQQASEAPRAISLKGRVHYPARLCKPTMTI
jgi:hypothetical protein